MKIKKSQRNSRFFFHRMGLIFFFLPILILVLGIVLPDRGFSEKENRVLASAPGLKLNQLTSGGFEKQFETYENDQFPLRDLWITLKASADRLMGKVEENGVLLGKNGYLMEEFKSPVQTQYDSTVKAMTDFAQRHSELKQYALIAPNSVNILKDKLPAFAPVIDQNLWLDDPGCLLCLPPGSKGNGNRYFLRRLCQITCNPFFSGNSLCQKRVPLRRKR